MVIGSLRRLARDRRGVSLIEFALVVPIFVLMILGGTEVARYVLLNEVLDRLATSTADLTAQEDDITAGDLTNIFASAPTLVWPFDINANGVVIITSVGLVNNQPKIYWQRTRTGSLTRSSRIGTEGGQATLPTGLTVAADDNIIVAEVYYNFTPFMWQQMRSGDIYHVAFTRPRLSNLTTVN
jgi:Flp pilus assembly protein TadG